MVTVGSAATDWANDGLFGDGWHLFGIGTSEYTEVADNYTAASEAISAYYELDTEADDFDPDAALADMKAVQPDSASTTIEVEDEETLAMNDMTVYYDAIPADADEETTVGMSYLDAVTYFEENGFDEPDPADYGVWVPGVPVLIGNALEAAGAAEWLNGLILDGIVAGVGAVLGFVPQMLVLFLMLAFLEACGYMARIAFVLDRIFRKFGLSGKSFIPMLIGTGCGIPGIMASRTIENERDRRMTIMTTTFIPCGAKVPFIAMIAGAIFGGACLGGYLRLLHRHGRHHHLRHHAEEDQDVCRRSRSLRHGAARLPLAHRGQRPAQHVGARLVLHQEGRHHHPAVHHRSSGSPPTSAGLTDGFRMLSEDEIDCSILAAHRQRRSPGSSHLSAGATGRPPWPPSPVWWPRKTSLARWASSTAAVMSTVYQALASCLYPASAATPSWCSTCCAPPALPPSAPSSGR